MWVIRTLYAKGFTLYDIYLLR